MSKKALGRGVAALFSTEGDEQGDAKNNIDIKKGITDNSEVISSDLDVKSNHSEVISKNLEVITDDSRVISSKKEVITYNSEVMKEAQADAKQNPRISLWSPKAATVLRYLRKTKPEFSISEEAGLLLEEAIMRKYPDLYEGSKKEAG